MSPALRTELARVLRAPDVAIAHTFRKPPYGGSNQFLLALRGELRRRGLRVGANVVGARTRACILNSFAFDEVALRTMLHAGCRVVHRVDGPVALYRGRDDGSDGRVQRLNEELAEATVLQSRYSLEASRAAGLEFRNPVVIHNAVDPKIFHPPELRARRDGHRIRLISSSWSDNPNKGAAALALLEHRLDWNRFELTFVGRSPVALEKGRMLPPVPSPELARLLRAHDAFIAPSRHEPCSNALLEALACGLPAVYRDSGANGELVGEAGVAFVDDDELPAAVEAIAVQLDDRRGRIAIPQLDEVADRYLEAMRIDLHA